MLSSPQILDNALKHQKAGRFELAERGYREILRLDPTHVDAMHLLGVAEYQLGRHEQSIEWIRKAISRNGKSATYYCNLGAALRAVGKQTEAVISFQKALVLNPDFAGVHYNLGNSLKDLRRFDEAVESYQRSIVLQPENADALNNLGDALKELGRTQAAIRAHQQAIRINPNLVEGHFNLANAFRANDQLSDAITGYQAALTLNPDYLEAYINLGYTFEDLGEMEKAIACYDQAIQLNPDLKAPHLNRALAWLRQQDFQRGWTEYEWRRKSEENHSAIDEMRIPRKQALVGAEVLITPEQGIGDQLMFASCLPDLLSLTSNVRIECEPRLVPLFLRSFPPATVVANSSGDRSFRNPLADSLDFHFPIASLPGLFRPDRHSFPRNTGYLIPDPARVVEWRERFDQLGTGAKIGISWRGGNSALVRHRRSTALHKWQSIFSLPNAHFINLQYGDSQSELTQIQETLGVPIHDWDDADPLIDLDNLAAQMSALDLVISVDNSTVHLAGALGVPAWVLLPFASDWRWFFSQDYSLWYSSLRLFHQTEFGEWDTVFHQVAEELEQLLSVQEKEIHRNKRRLNPQLLPETINRTEFNRTEFGLTKDAS